MIFYIHFLQQKLERKPKCAVIIIRQSLMRWTTACHLHSSSARCSFIHSLKQLCTSQGSAGACSRAPRVRDRNTLWRCCWSIARHKYTHTWCEFPVCQIMCVFWTSFFLVNPVGMCKLCNLNSTISRNDSNSSNSLFEVIVQHSGSIITSVVIAVQIKRGPKMEPWGAPH